MKNMNSPILIRYLRQYEKDPKSKVFAALAEIHRKNGMLDDALKIYHQGLRHNPHYFLGLLGLAHCYNDKKEYEKSYAVLSKLQAQSSDNLKYLELFSKVCLSLKKDDEALEVLKSALFLNPKNKETANLVKRLESKEAYQAHEKKSYLEKGSEDEKEISRGDSPEDLDSWVAKDFSCKVTEQEEASQMTEELLQKRATFIDDWNIKTESSFRSKEKLEEKKEGEEKGTSAKRALVTHTLVDLYISQGHYQKALEILVKLSEADPYDSATTVRYNEINQILEKQKVLEKLSGQPTEHHLLLDMVAEVDHSLIDQAVKEESDSSPGLPCGKGADIPGPKVIGPREITASRILALNSFKKELRDSAKRKMTI